MIDLKLKIDRMYFTFTLLYFKNDLIYVYVINK